MASDTASPATGSSSLNNYSKTVTSAIAGDNTKWLVFRVARPSPDTLMEDERARLEAFLTRAAPSKVKTADGICWISIGHEKASNSEDITDDDTEDREATEDSMLRDWNSGCEVRDLSQVHELARKYGVLSGKWMLFMTSDKVDKLWGKIARAVMEKQLGPHVTSAKVRPY